MVAFEFLEHLSRLQVVTYVGVEDMADKINFNYTVILLMLCTIIITVKQYFMRPITCYVATSLSGAILQDFVDHYCWVCGTFPIGFKDKLPETREDWAAVQGQKIQYYQWLPFFLGFQGILFYLPRVIWQIFCYNHTGADLQQMIINGNHALHSDMVTRKRIVENIARTLEESLFKQRIPVPRRPTKKAILQRLYRIFVVAFCRFDFYGIRVVSGYFVVKVLFILNTILQLSLCVNFLAKVTLSPVEGMPPQYTTFSGLEVISNLINGKEWHHTRAFPRLTLCPVPVRYLGVDGILVAQCAMPVNMFNEKIYIFLWLWFTVTLIANLTSVPLWGFKLFHTAAASNFVRKFLQVSLSASPLKPEEKVYVNIFLRQFVGPDGLFMLHMVSSNCGDALTAEITTHLWCNFMKKYQIYSHVAEYCREEDMPMEVANHVAESDLDTETTTSSQPPPAAPKRKSLLTMRNPNLLVSLAPNKRLAPAYPRFRPRVPSTILE